MLNLYLALTLHTGYCEFTRPVSFKWIKEHSGLNSIHLEGRKGTRSSAREYCMKADSRYHDGGPWESGSWTDGGQGKRNDLATFYKRLKSDPNITDKQLLDEFPATFLRYPKAAETIRRVTGDAYERKTPEVYFLFGPPGCGKTTWCEGHSKSKGRRVYWKAPDEWWSGYNGTDDIMLDDFYGWLPVHLLLRLLDRHPINLNTKGGHIQANPTAIYVTSNKLPKSWYRDEVRSKYNFLAVYRRITFFAILKLPAGSEPEIVLESRSEIDDFFVDQQ